MGAAQIGTLKYAPPANDNGAALASFTFRVNDGTDDSVATNTMTVNVTAVNDAPTSADKEVVTDEDTDYTFSSADFPFADTDTGDTLSSVKIVSLPSEGTLTLSGTALTSGDLPQTVTAADLTGGLLKNVPLANSNLGVTFTFRVNDGTDDSAETYGMTVYATAVSDVAMGQPGITGTAQVGEVLTATVGDIADVDGLPDPFFSVGDATTTVQWLRVDGAATRPIFRVSRPPDFTYTLVAADEGKKIRVKVNFNDKAGFANGPLTSDAYPSSGTVLPAANIAPTSADKTVVTPEDTEYTFSSADFAFTDTDMGGTSLKREDRDAAGIGHAHALGHGDYIGGPAADGGHGPNRHPEIRPPGERKRDRLGEFHLQGERWHGRQCGDEYDDCQCDGGARLVAGPAGDNGHGAGLELR